MNNLNDITTHSYTPSLFKAHQVTTWRSVKGNIKVIHSGQQKQDSIPLHLAYNKYSNFNIMICEFQATVVITVKSLSISSIEVQYAILFSVHRDSTSADDLLYHTSHQLHNSSLAAFNIILATMPRSSIC